MASTPRVAIIGAGIVGCSLADELVLRGWSNVVVIEQGPLFAAGGSTSHAPGLVFQTNGSKTMAEFARYTVEKSCSLELDGEWCFNQVGSLELALTEDRLRELHRRQGFAESWGIESRVIDPDETARLWPLVDRDAILGAYHVPTDGLAKAVRVSEAQARRATEGGARFLGGHTVTGIRTDDGRVRAVVTDQGEIEADIVVCAAGIWGPLIGAMVGMTVPLQPLAHQYTKTTVLPEMAPFAIPPDRENVHPIVRAQDRDLYFREHVDRLGVGSYAHVAMPIDAATILSPSEAPVMPSVLDFTPDTFAESWSWAQGIVPALRRPGVQVESGINGIFSFTTDGAPLMGESADVKGFWLAEAVWVTHACGVGKAMAEWLVDGGSPTDLHECDVNRFEAHQLAPSYIHDRGVQNYIEVYDIIHPLQPMEDPRPLRTSPFYEREQELGAFFLEGNGWERPHWYGVNEGLLGRYEIPRRNAWAERYWHPIAGAEALATRETAGLYDMTSLKRLEVTGPGALAFLDGLTTNRLDRAVGTVVYSLMLDERGGIRSDLTIARLGAGPLPDRGERESRLRPAPASRTAGRQRVGPRHHLGHLLHRPVGTAGPRHPRLADRQRRDQRGVPLLPGPRAVGRERAGHGAPPVVCRRARLGAVHDGGHGDEAVGHAVGRRPAARPDRRRPERLRQPAPREGLSLVGRGHDDRARSLRGRARVRGPHGQGRFRGERRAGRAERGERGQATRAPDHRGPSGGRDGQGAGRGGRPTRRLRHQRRVRVFDRRAHRVRMASVRGRPRRADRSRSATSARRSRRPSPPIRCSTRR